MVKFLWIGGGRVFRLARTSLAFCSVRYVFVRACTVESSVVVLNLVPAFFFSNRSFTSTFSRFSSEKAVRGQEGEPDNPDLVGFRAGKGEQEDAGEPMLKHSVM